MILEVITGIIGFCSGFFYSKWARTKKTKETIDNVVFGFQSTIDNLNRKSSDDEQCIQKLTEELHLLRKKYRTSGLKLIDLEEDNKSLKVKLIKLQNEIVHLKNRCVELQKACDAKNFEILSLRNK